jgi:hypothetical protein
MPGPTLHLHTSPLLLTIFPLSLHPPVPPTPRRSTRLRFAPRAHSNFIPQTVVDHFIGVVEEGGEPISFHQACSGPRWLRAMTSEYNSINKNNTWDLVLLPPGVGPISARWVFKIKPGPTPDATIFKARIVARGNEKVHGVNFQETCAPTIRWESIRLIISIAAHHGWALYQLDVVTAFLNGHLDEDIFRLQPPSCVEPGKEHMVCKLRRSLYGLRQSPRAWYSRIDSYLRRRGLERTAADSNVYFYRRLKILILLVLYVDDLMLTGSDPVFIADLTRDLRHEFEMKDLGLMRKFLGVQVRQTTHGIFLHQSDYAQSIIQRFLTPLDRPSHIPLSPTFQLRKNTKTPFSD